MGIIFLDEVVNDSDLAESFTIQRNLNGAWVAGGWSPGAPTTIPGYGVVSVATQEELEMVPEGDRVSGMMAFWSTQQLFETHADGTPGTSDVLVWNGYNYRVAVVRPYPNRGYWKAIAARMLGS